MNFIDDPLASLSKRRGFVQREAARLDQQLVDQRRSQRRQVDFELIAGLRHDVVGAS